MRVEYSLPSLQLDKLPEPATPEEAAISFREQLQGLAGEMPMDWQQEMKLDSRPPDATYLEPPACPSTMDIRDPQSERARWRTMLTRHGTSMAGANRNSSTNRHSVQVMLDMLLDMQQAEDSIVSQSSALTRG
ncbi:MAG: hypothetical protein WCB05_16345 [Candidatus Sulfotelmatobacter sp.]|jgi:hypothetical protein